MGVVHTPEVSVVLPVRQWRSTTAAAVQSLLEQTLENLEIVVVGQQDVASLADRLPPDRRIRLVARTGPGLVNALNTGLDTARGRYIARMDDDDLAHITRLEQQHVLLQRSDIQLSGTRVRFIDASGGNDNVGRGNQRYADWLNGLTTPDDIRDACFIECPLPHPTLMAHRDIWQILGRYRNFDGPEDHDLVLRAWLKGLSMGKPQEILLDWREHSERLTWHDKRYRREAFTRLRAAFAAHPDSGFDLDKGRPVWLCGTGRNARFWFDALRAERVEVAGFVDLDRVSPRKRKRHRPVITYKELWQQRRDEFVITAITQPDARAKLLQRFSDAGWMAGKDYLAGG